MDGLDREVFPVVWLVRRQPRARRDKVKSRRQKRGHVLDQIHEQDLAGGGLLCHVIGRGTVPPVSSSLSPNRLRAQMVLVSPVTCHSSDKHGRRACPGRVAL